MLDRLDPSTQIKRRITRIQINSRNLLWFLETLKAFPGPQMELLSDFIFRSVNNRVKYGVTLWIVSDNPLAHLAILKRPVCKPSKPGGQTIETRCVNHRR